MAVVIQDVGVRVEEDDVVAHQRCHHDQHFQLVVHPQENRAGYQPQDAAVYKVLGQENMSDQCLESLLRNAEIRIKIGDHHRAHWSTYKLAVKANAFFSSLKQW